LRDQLLPTVIGWAQRDPDWPNPAYIELYHRIFDLLAMSGPRSESAIDALRNLLRGMLSIGLPRREYVDLLGTVRDVVNDLSGGDYLDHLVDILEVTADVACPDPTVRRELWETALGILAQFVARLSDSRQMLLRELATMLGLQELLAQRLAAPPASAVSRVHLPRRMQVALYTLTESVGRRVKEQVERQYDGLTVTIDSSHDRTPQLVNLARHADLFVVCWRSAKHAATDVVGAERPTTLPTRYALGRGSSSIMALIAREVDALAGVRVL
jgi:hypothetical protein